MESGDSEDDDLGDSSFFDVYKFTQAEHLEPAEVLMKIEVIIKELIQNICSNQHKIGFELVKPSNSNSHLIRNEIHLGNDKKYTSLFSNSTSQHFSRMCKVLAFVHGLLSDKKQATLREAYYCMIEDFPTQNELNRAVLDVTSLLQCTRRSLGLMAGSKGEIAGQVKIQCFPEEAWFDCISIPMHISGEMSPLILFESFARYILVIEKDGIFQRLCEDRIYNQIPCILVCGKGYPDLGTRAMVRQMQDKLQLPVLGIVDYNVHGLAILLTYKLGSVRMGLESFQYVSDIKWLGLRGSSLQQLDLPDMCFQDLTTRDKRKIDLLLASPFIKEHETFEEELKLMKQIGKKAELQALFHLGRDGITNFICKMILNKQWI